MSDVPGLAIEALPGLPGTALWRVNLDVPPDAQALRTLSDAQRQRAARFVFPRDRARYEAAHVALRALLAGFTGQAPEAIRYLAGDHGKPAMAQPGACEFNLTHSGGVALVAIAPAGHGGLGVDVEVLRAVPDAMALADRYFTPAEQRALASVHPAQRSVAFLVAWTRKEACLKATGHGLRIDPAKVDVGIEPVDRAVDVRGCGAPGAVLRVQLRSLSIPDAAGAWAAVVGDACAEPAPLAATA